MTSLAALAGYSGLGSARLLSTVLGLPKAPLGRGRSPRPRSAAPPCGPNASLGLLPAWKTFLPSPPTRRGPSGQAHKSGISQPTLVLRDQKELPLHTGAHPPLLHQLTERPDLNAGFLTCK